MKYCASITFAGRKIQISHRSATELVRALRDMGRSITGNLQVHKIYTKGK